MAFDASPIAHTTGIGGSGGATSSAWNTTGANLLIIGATGYQTGSPTCADTLGNTFTPLTEYSDTTLSSVMLWYCYNPTTSASNTVTVGGLFWAVMGQAWKTAHSSPYDQQTGNSSASATSIQPGSLTPSQNGCLIVSVLCKWATTNAVSIDSGFTISDQIPNGSGTNLGSAMAYLVQGTAAAVNPNWSGADAASHLAVTQASFFPGGAAASRLVKMAGNWGGFAGRSGGFAG